MRYALEAHMRRVSLWVSAVAIVLMTTGFVAMLVRGEPFSGPSALPLASLAHPYQAPLDLLATSLGLVLLALLPSARVLLAGVLYIRERRARDALIALIVLLELLFSIVTGRG